MEALTGRKAMDAIAARADVGSASWTLPDVRLPLSFYSELLQASSISPRLASPRLASLLRSSACAPRQSCRPALPYPLMPSHTHTMFYSTRTIGLASAQPCQPGGPAGPDRGVTHGGRSPGAVKFECGRPGRHGQEAPCQ
eukprot:764688-Hanusia_phi.AAC.1